MNSKNITLFVSVVLLFIAIPSVFAANVLLQWQNAPNDYQYTVHEGSFAPVFYNANVYGGGYYTLKLYNANGDLISTVKEKYSMTTGEKGFINITPSHYVTYGNYTLKLFAQDPSSSETYKLGLTVLCTDANNNAICDDHENFSSITLNANPDHGVAPLQVQFTCSAVGGSTPISYTWNFGDGVTSTQQNPTHIYQSKGMYTATCTAKDSMNKSISGSVNITVTEYINQAPVANFSAIPTSGYAPLTVYFDGTTSIDPDGIIVMYAWDIDGSVHFAQGELAQYTFTQPGTYNVSLTVVDDDEATATTSKLITVLEKPNVLPIAKFTANPQTGNAPLDVTFNATQSFDPDGTIVNYEWFLGSDKFSSGIITSKVFNLPGSYDVTLKVTDNRGGTATTQKTVTVTQAPNHPPVLNPIGDKVVFENQTLSFKVTASDLDNDSLMYMVSHLPTGASFTNQQFVWTPDFTQQGVYTITFSVSDGKDIDTETIKITVLNVNRKPTADFSIVPNPALVNQQVIMDGSASTDPDGDTLTYSWDMGDESGLEGNVAIMHYAYDTQGTYTITLTVSDGELTDTVQKTIVIENKLNVEGISCIPEIVAGNLQSCGVKVTSGSGPLANANVDVYYVDGSYFGSCLTDKDGDCRAEAIVHNVGNYTVYAKATKEGYINDTDTYPRTSFMVYTERYDIVDLKVYNDPQFLNEDYDFFRGENLYVKFRVQELHTSSYVTDDIVAKAMLVSQGYAIADLTKIGMDGDFFLFKLTPIPLQHDFIGSSQIFTFAFNYSDGSGGQKEVGVMIRNNPPKIFPPLPDFELTVGASDHLDLKQHEFDLEDTRENLTWSYTQEGSSVRVDVHGKALDIDALTPGITKITFTLKDWDGDTDSQTITATVFAKPENNTAPLVVITKPSSGDQFNENELITFEGNAHDNEDGVLIPSWHSSLDGDLGSGNTIAKKLSLGTHLITLSAVDSKGLVGTDSITVVVTKQQPSEITADIGGPYYAWPKTTITLDASKSSGPIEYYLFDFGDGTSVKQQTPFAPHIYDGAKDSYTVVLTVIGDQNQTATDTTTVYMKKQNVVPADERVSNELYIGTINVYGFDGKQDYLVGKNEDLVVDLGIENDGDDDLSGVTAMIIIPELGIKQTTGSFKLDTGDTVSKSLVIPMVDVSPGEYYMKIIVGNGKTIRVKYRYFIVE